MPYTEDGGYVVVVDDIVFRCYIEELGSRNERRWIFETKAAKYNAMAASFPIVHEMDLIKHVQDWYQMKRALGQEIV